MAIDDSRADDHQSRLAALIEEFKQAQHRRLVKRGLALLKQMSVETPVACVIELPTQKIN